MKINSRAQLVDLMKHLGLPLTAVEVGVAEGQFSSELLQAGVDKLYLIDLWDRMPFITGCASFEQEWHDKNYNEVIERTKSYGDKVVILKGFSHKMAAQIPDESLGLVYEDSNHMYEGVKSTIEFFLPKLAKGGIFAFHDFANEAYGVNRAVIEFTSVMGIPVHQLNEDGNINNIGAYFIKQ
jgi:hypothetical protein